MSKQIVILNTKLRTANNLLTGRYNTNLTPAFLQKRIQDINNKIRLSKAAQA